MADINDTNSSRAKLDREWELLDDADIDDRDREVIGDFADHRREIEDKSVNTVINDMGNLRRAAERASTPLVDMGLGAVRVFVGRLTDPRDAGGYGLDPDGGGMFGYRRALRVFFNWLDEETAAPEEEHGDYPFGDRIELPDRNTDQNKITKEDLLSEEEIEQLKRACLNNRDRALIDFLADVGARISLATSLRVGDLNGLDTPTPTFRPNTDAVGLKGVEERRYPILYSRSELREWVNRHHPDRSGENGQPHPEAPLFPVVKQYEPGDRANMAAHGDTIRAALDRAGRRAGIGRKVHPHHFRHVFMTRVSGSDLKDRDIEHMSMLTDDQMRMLDRYDHTDDEERNASIFKSHGFVDESADDDSAAAPEIVTCFNCRSEVKSTAWHCPSCGIALRDEVQDAINAARAEMQDTAVSADERAKREAAVDVESVVESDTRVAEEFAVEDGHLDEK